MEHSATIPAELLFHFSAMRTEKGFASPMKKILGESAWRHYLYSDICMHYCSRYIAGIRKKGSDFNGSGM